MVTLVIGNSYSQVKGLKTTEFRKLRKLLSYQTDPHAAYFAGGYVRTNYLIDAKGTFPTGLIKKVMAFLNETPYQIEDTRRDPGIRPGAYQLNLGSVVPYPDQWHASLAAVFRRRGGIVMPTGTGKSLVIALIIAKLGVRTLVVVPSLEIKKQLKESLDRVFGPQEGIVVENIDSSALGSARNFDCLIIDECHHTAAKTYQKLNKRVWNDIYYRFFLTATFYRNQENEQLLFEGVAGEIIFELTHFNAVRHGYIVPVEAFYVDLPKRETDAFTWRQVYSELVVNNLARNQRIADLLTNLKEQGLFGLCLVKEISHGEILSEMTGIPFANGKDEDTRAYIGRFNRGEIKQLIGTTGILGEGVDTKPAEYVIIAGFGKAKSAFMQQIGRGVRRYPGKESCKVILFRDKSHKFLLRHFNEQCRILKDIGVIATKLELD